MPKQSTIFIKGTIGNVVFYELDGRHIVRSRPAKVEQTTNMRQRSQNFGVAARAGKVLRLALAPLLPFPKDNKMQRRFSGAVAKWLGSQPVTDMLPQPAVNHLYGFQFNEATRFEERFKVSINCNLAVPGQVAIHIPGFIPIEALAAPAHTVYAELNIIATACRLADATQVSTETFSQRIVYNNTQQPANQLEYNIAAPEGTLVLVAASLSFWLTNGKKEMRETFLPASVLKAGYW